MPEVRLLVPIDDHKVDDVIDVDVETAEAWRAAGKVSLITAETEQPGHYTDVVGREDVMPLTPGASPPGPQTAEEDEDDDKPKSSKKGKK